LSVTTPTNVDTSIPEIWAKNVLRHTKVEGFWGRFVGAEGSDAPIVQKSELLNGPGDLIHIQVTSALTGAGQSGDTATLEGNEENLTTSEIKVSPLLRRHAVRNNRRAVKKSIVDLRNEAGFRLAEWGRDKMDSVRFTNFLADALPSPLGSETYDAYSYAVGSAPGTISGGIDDDDVTASDTLSVAALQAIKLTLTTNLAKPMMIDGFPHYALVTHPNATYQLKQEARYESWVREAQVRGASNPFFRGALVVIDGMVIYEHVSVPRAANAGSVKVASGIAFGSNAFVEGLDENVHSEEKTFDYGLELGKSYEFAFQPRRALEKDSMRVFCAAPDLS
jgi:N4-gp56 family major capsid protein